MSDKSQLASVAPGMSHAQFEVFIDFLPGQMLEPFHQAHAVAVEILPEVQPFTFLAAANPVQIDMIDRQPAFILVDQSKTRAANPSVLTYLQSLRHPAHKTGLASPQFADEPDDLAATKQTRQPSPPPAGFLLRMGNDSKGVHPGTAPSNIN